MKAVTAVVSPLAALAISYSLLLTINWEHPTPAQYGTLLLGPILAGFAAGWCWRSSGQAVRWGVIPGACLTSATWVVFEFLLILGQSKGSVWDATWPMLVYGLLYLGLAVCGGYAAERRAPVRRGGI
jgi:hypothetical protein